MNTAHEACQGPGKPGGEWIIQWLLCCSHFARITSTHVLALMNKVMVSLSSVNEI